MSTNQVEFLVFAQLKVHACGGRPGLLVLSGIQSTVTETCVISCPQNTGHFTSVS